jgi:general secretion pathway protein C
VAALVLLGAVLAYWTWAWLAPPPAPRAPAAVEIARDASSAGGLFGSVRQGAGPAASSAVRLMGVVAASGGRRGHAVMRLDGTRTVAVLQGEDVEPGLRLAEVHVDHIVLERNGARETLAWPEKKGK